MQAPSVALDALVEPPDFALQSLETATYNCRHQSHFSNEAGSQATLRAEAGHAVEPYMEGLANAF